VAQPTIVGIDVLSQNFGALLVPKFRTIWPTLRQPLTIKSFSHDLTIDLNRCKSPRSGTVNPESFNGPNITIQQFLQPICCGMRKINLERTTANVCPRFRSVRAFQPNIYAI